MSNSTTNISQARKAVEQLKMEAYMDRMKVNLDFGQYFAFTPYFMVQPTFNNPKRLDQLKSKFCVEL